MTNPTSANCEPASDQRSAALLAELAVSGRTLIFCDDTDIAGQPVANLKPDLRLLVAVQMRSDGYAQLDASLATALNQFGVTEFHATDIATGNREWRGREQEERAAALDFLAEQLAEHATRVGAVWLPKHQYSELRAQAEVLGSVKVGFKQGLKRVLVRGVVERLAAAALPAMLWLDQDKPQTGARVEDWPEAKFLIGGGPVVAPSHLVRGLQIADLAIWSVQRFMTKRAGYDDGTAGDFENVAARVVAGFPTGLDDLRGDAFLEDWVP